MKIRIDGTAVGPGEPMYVVAEAGANHDGELSKAKRLIEAADEANANAVKFQNYTADKLVTRTAKKWWGDTSTPQYETYNKLDTLTRADNVEMADHAANIDITFFSTPFDKDAVDLLSELDVPAYKIASGDLTNHPLLRYTAEQNKPVILSTGMSTLSEIREAVEVIESAGNEQIILLHCVSVYPTPIEDINLGMMQTLMEEFEYPVGLSDHTEGVLVPVAATAMGADLLEKHFTFDKTLDKSPDHRLSADVEEMQEIMTKSRRVHNAVGRKDKEPILSEMETRHKARRSLVAERSFNVGERIEQSDIGIKRPATGIAPKYYWSIDDWYASRNINADEVLTWHNVDTDEPRSD